MTEKTRCVFTGAQAERTRATDDMTTWLYLEGPCGYYRIREEVADLIQSDKPFTPQALINCARRTLELHRQDKSSCACWMDRVLAKSAPPRAWRELHLVPCAFEDALDELVDHSGKPVILLESLARKLSRSGAFIGTYLAHDDRIWARIPDKDELHQVILYLEGQGWIRRGDSAKLRRESAAKKPTDLSDPFTDVFSTPVAMTVDGWAVIRERMQGIHSNQVFIATQFKWPDAEEPLRLGALDAIKRACESCGYEAEPVEQHHTDTITDRIIADIKRARFVVAELSYNNRGVYYEAGFARGLGMTVIHVVRQGHVGGDDTGGKRIHFDIAQIPYIEWSDLSHLEERLRDRIGSILGHYGAGGR